MCIKDRRYGLEGTVIGSAKGAALEHVLLKHPFQERDVALICGPHVTLEAGTGLVHTAPAHGADAVSYTHLDVYKRQASRGESGQASRFR